MTAKLRAEPWSRIGYSIPDVTEEHVINGNARAGEPGLTAVNAVGPAGKDSTVPGFGQPHLELDRGCGGGGHDASEPTDGGGVGVGLLGARRVRTGVELGAGGEKRGIGDGGVGQFERPQGRTVPGRDPKDEETQDEKEAGLERHAGRGGETALARGLLNSSRFECDVKKSGSLSFFERVADGRNRDLMRDL
jgi:hypothetical protein